jgi:phytoene/squalene synthetase
MASLFMPEPQRESLLALYALNIELLHIPAKISEEMIGHIRYAWWQERVEGLYNGDVPQGHPVLVALTGAAPHVPQTRLVALVEEYREHYPEPPQRHNEAVDAAAADLVQALTPAAFPVWQKASAIIGRHRQRYGNSAKGWLAFKLLLAAGW